MKEIRAKTIDHFIFYCLDNLILTTLLLIAASYLWNGNQSTEQTLVINASKMMTAFGAVIVGAKIITDYPRSRAVAEFEFINGLKLRGDSRRLRPLVRYLHKPSITERIYHRAGQLRQHQWQQR